MKNPKTKMVVQVDYDESSDEDEIDLNIEMLTAGKLGLPVNKRMASKNSAYSKASDSTVDTSASYLKGGSTSNQDECELAAFKDQDKPALKMSPKVAEAIVLARQKSPLCEVGCMSMHISRIELQKKGNH